MNTQVKFITALLVLAWLTPATTFGADCLIPCPGDVTGDCKVDMDDFLILSQNWLTDCSGITALPVLKVIDVGISPSQAGGLAKILGIPQEQLIFEPGFPVQYIDPKGHMAIPTVPFEDPQLIAELLKETEQDGESKIVFEALDEKQLRAIVPVPPQTALSEVVKALQETGIALGDGEPSVSHSTFELMDTQGNLLLPAVQMNTRVQFNSAIQGVPIMGPGAKFSVSYNPQGDVTELLLARRGVEAVRETFPLINPQQAVQRAFGAEAAARFVPEQEAQLVYYAPPLSEQGVQTLIPHYDIGGIIFTPEGAQFHKLRRLIPAIADPSYVPTVGLEAWVEG
ncbi:MAG: hypothetical protein JXB18_09290, partial [Sedimentisphaerales bacterium]|nr:hypothetical protein [Sedimentisphaerales bacterium]